MRVLWLGTYERDYPRTRVLVQGLRGLGAQVQERHTPVWERTRHKAGGFLRPGPLARAGGQAAVGWARMAAGALRGGPVDVVVAGYPAQPDAIPAWVVARSRRALLVADMMISLADTLGGDRGRAGAGLTRLLAGIDRTTLALADVVMADTHANADFLHRRFGVPRAKLVVVPVGAEPQIFPPAPHPEGPPQVLFYGKLSPLHGVDTVVQAARMPGVPPLRLIGEGQLSSWLEAEVARDRPPGLRWDPWVPYEDLGREVREASVCLGVFGTSDKAARVVPNKVWQAMAAARPVVSADSAGIREAVVPGVNGLLTPPGDAPALAAALRTLAADRALRVRMGDAARAAYLHHGAPEAVARLLHDALCARLASGRPRRWKSGPSTS